MAADAEIFKRRHERMVDRFRGLPLDEQLKNFISSVTMTTEDRRLRDRVVEDLIWVLQPEFPDIRIHPFGSFVSELGDRDSDLDVFADCVGNAMEGGKSLDPERKKEIFDIVCRIIRTYQFRRRNPLFSDVIRIDGARVPIIKFVHRETGIHADISFENVLSVRNSHLIKLMTELDPRVRPLMCLVRYFGKFHGLTGSTSIKNYGFILMVLVYLRWEEILPRVCELQQWEGIQEFRVDHWNAAFCSDKEAICKFLDGRGRPPPKMNENNEPKAKSILKLFAGFLKTYSEFAADTHIVCPLVGSFIPRQWFEDETELLSEFEDYRKFSAVADQIGQRRLNTAPLMSFVIQDPFALNFNVSAVTREPVFKKFQRACTQTASHLRTLLHSGKKLNLMDTFIEVDCSDIPGASRRRQKLHKTKEEKRAERNKNAAGVQNSVVVVVENNNQNSRKRGLEPKSNGDAELNSSGPNSQRDSRIRLLPPLGMEPVCQFPNNEAPLTNLAQVSTNPPPAPLLQPLMNMQMPNPFLQEASINERPPAPGLQPLASLEMPNPFLQEGSINERPPTPGLLHVPFNQESSTRGEGRGRGRLPYYQVPISQILGSAYTQF